MTRAPYQAASCHNDYSHIHGGILSLASFCHLLEHSSILASAILASAILASAILSGGIEPSHRLARQATWLVCACYQHSQLSEARFFNIRLGLYSKKFQKCLINYLGLSYEQTVTSQLYLLVNHHRDCSSLLQSL